MLEKWEPKQLNELTNLLDTRSTDVLNQLTLDHEHVVVQAGLSLPAKKQV